MTLERTLRPALFALGVAALLWILSLYGNPALEIYLSRWGFC